MKKLIIGSTAIKHWFPDFDREPRDLDYISREGIMTGVEEHHWIDAFLLLTHLNKDEVYADPDILYTLKVSHAAWDVKWEKTMHDINFLKSKGCKLNYYLYKELYDNWEKVHGSKRVNLKMPPKKFFNENITRKMDHDELHEHYAFYDQPLHIRIRPDDNSAWCSRKLWNELSHEDQIKCALEEIYVIATERYSNRPPRFAKIKAMKNLITSMTTGWFNLFLIENNHELLYNDFDETHFIPKLKEYKEKINDSERS